MAIVRDEGLLESEVLEVFRVLKEESENASEVVLPEFEAVAPRAFSMTSIDIHVAVELAKLFGRYERSVGGGPKRSVRWEDD